MEYEEVRQIMEAENPVLVALQPFAQPIPQATFNQVDENTQNSVFHQREIEELSTHFTIGKNLTNPGNGFITHRVHDQKLTSLCVSFSTVTTVRGATIRVLIARGFPDDEIRNQLENVDEYSFNKMLTLFTGCISPRSLDGLILNSRNDAHFMDAQTQITRTAVDRLVYQTGLEEPGWKRITPLVELLEHFNLNPNYIELQKIPVFHHSV